MLTGHRQKQTGDFRIRTVVLVERLPNVVTQRHIVFRFAADFASVAAKATASINEPAVVLAVFRLLHAVLPEFFWLEKLILLLRSSQLGFARRTRGSNGCQRSALLDKFASACLCRFLIVWF